MEIVQFETIEEMMGALEMFREGFIIEDDIFECVDFTDENDRSLHDAQVLTTLAANAGGNCFEVGTSLGRGTYKMATNIVDLGGVVYTLNAVADQTSGQFVTHKLTKEEIGSYLREHGIENFVQYYGDSKTWNISKKVNGVSLVYIDGCHDEDYVYSDSSRFFPKLKSGGIIAWHDFSPVFEGDPRAYWITSCMAGVRRFCEENGIKTVYHLKNSWTGFAIKE